MKCKKIISVLLAVCMVVGLLPTVAPVTNAVTDEGLEIVDAPVIGGTYYLAANVNGVMKYFTTGTVTSTVPYSLVTTERISGAVPVTLENSTATNEKFEGGFQLTYDNNGSTARIYCMDVLKDATTAGQTGVMDTGVNSSTPYKNRHSFFVDEVNSVNVLRKYGNDNILVVKHFESTGTYRMLGVPEAELANDGVYPVSLYAEHTHEAGTQATVIDDDNHGYACDCGSIVSTEAHTYGQTTEDTTAKTVSRTCTACGYVQTIYSNSQLQVKAPAVGGTYYLSANVNGTLKYFCTPPSGGSVTNTSPYSLYTTESSGDSQQVTLLAAITSGKGSFQLSFMNDSKEIFIYCHTTNGTGTTSTTSTSYYIPDRASFSVDEVNGVSVLRKYSNNYVLVVKQLQNSKTGSLQWHMLCVPESELANEGVYPVMLTTPPVHTHTYGTAYEKDTTGHWHVCDCGEASEKEAHSFVDGKCICGKRETEAVLEEGIYYLKATLSGVTYYFRHALSGESVTHTAPYSLYVDTNKTAATLVDAIKEASGDFSLGYPYNDNTARIYVYDVGSNGSVDTGVNTQNVAANHHFQWDGDNARLYQLETGVKYVLAIKEMNNTNTGTKQIKMLAVKESELSDTVVPVELEAHTTHTVDTWEVTTPATTSTPGVKTGSCTVCKREVQAEIPVLTPSFNGNNLSLTDAFSLHFYVDKAAFHEGVYEAPYVIFDLEGTKTTVSAYAQDENSYIFTFEDITPDKMGATVTATLYATKQGAEQAYATKTYSVAEYCYEMLQQEQTGDALRTLLVDTLNFGAACQQYRNSDAELVNANLTEEQRSWGSSDPLRALESCKNIGTNNGEVKWYGVSALMGDRVQMRVYFNAADATDLTVQAESVSGSWTLDDIQTKDDMYYVDFSHLAPTQMSEEVTFTVYRGETVVSSTMHYSLESYAAPWLGKSDASDAQKELVTAMIRYGDAAKNYIDRTYDLQEDVLYMGRTYERTETQWFNWSASGFTVNFRGSGIKAQIASNAPNATNYAYLKVYVDGVEQEEDVLLDKTMQTITLAEGLDPNVTHTVEVRKRNSPRSSTAGLVYLELTDGTKLAPPTAKERLIEFVGDSLTVGYSASDEAMEETKWSTRTEDGTRTYSKQVADAFGAEYMVTAISGRGIVMNNQNAGAPWFKDIYPKLDIYNDPDTEYDFSLQPDVIVVNLGSNDATNADLDLDVFQAGVVSFIQMVREKNPNAKIIWAYGMRWISADVMHTEAGDAIQAAIEELNDPEVYYVPLEPVDNETEIHITHPIASSYAARGEKLIEKIREITGWQ